MEDLFLFDFVRCAPPYSKRYCIKKDGSQVFDCITGKNVQKHKTKDGYIAFNTMINDNGKRTFPLIHNMIGDNLIARPTTKKKISVVHIDGDKLNNSIENLEWRTVAKERVASCKSHRKRNRRVYQYDKDTMGLVRVYRNTTKAKDYGFSSDGISRCCNGIYKQYKGYIFSYIKFGEEHKIPKQLELDLVFD